MYYQNYEDYMRTILGYPVERQNTYSNNNCLHFNDTNLAIQNMPRENQYVQVNFARNDESDVLNFYPEIYRIVNPMICKVCEKYNEPITKELVVKMTDEVYNNLEETDSTTVVNINATLSNNTIVKNERMSTTNNESNAEVENKMQNKNSKTSQSMQTYLRNKDSISSVKNKENVETRQVKPKNNLLRDLIQILILKRLLEGNRPPVINPPRPPRPPIRPRDYNDMYKF